ncbi:MAG: TIGR03936 family radical SAM-associated protein [Gemmataceae bacterium]
MFGEKLRFRFEKTGTLRLLSHHDLMRCFERILRRTGLPFKSTGGFHPTPRIVFALSLSLGIEGRDECVEIEFLHEVDADEAFAKLNDQCPAGLRFTKATVVPMKATAVPRRAVYAMDLPADRLDAARKACFELMDREKVWVDRFKPSEKQLNIRPYLRAVSVREGEAPAGSAAPHPREDGSAGAAPSRLVLDLWVTQTGTARTDELLRLLNLADVPDSGAVLRRELLELRDEITGSDPADVPPDGPAETLPLAPGAAVAAHRDREPVSLTAHWGATLAGPVVE